jgi:hypothetical protein
VSEGFRFASLDGRTIATQNSLPSGSFMRTQYSSPLSIDRDSAGYGRGERSGAERLRVRVRIAPKQVPTVILRSA